MHIKYTRTINVSVVVDAVMNAPCCSKLINDITTEGRSFFSAAHAVTKTFTHSSKAETYIDVTCT